MHSVTTHPPSNPDPLPVLRLPCALTIASASTLRHELLSCIESAKTGCIDCAAVEDVDTVGVQLLLSALRTAHQAGLGWRISETPPKLRELISAVGLNEDLSVST